MEWKMLEYITYTKGKTLVSETFVSLMCELLA